MRAARCVPFLCDAAHITANGIRNTKHYGLCMFWGPRAALPGAAGSEFCSGAPLQGGTLARISRRHGRLALTDHDRRLCLILALCARAPPRRNGPISLETMLATFARTHLERPTATRMKEVHVQNRPAIKGGAFMAAACRKPPPILHRVSRVEPTTSIQLPQQEKSCL